MTPVHSGQSQDRGVEIWVGAELLGRASSRDEAWTLAMVMLMGPQRIGGTLIRCERTRLNIARNAITYMIEGMATANTNGRLTSV